MLFIGSPLIVIRWTSDVPDDDELWTVTLWERKAQMDKINNILNGGRSLPIEMKKKTTNFELKGCVFYPFDCMLCTC